MEEHFLVEKKVFQAVSEFVAVNVLVNVLFSLFLLPCRT